MMNRKQLQAIIFDFDGVILDTESALFESWKRLYAEHGHDFSLDRWAANVGGYQYDVFDPLSHLEEVTGIPVNRDAVNAARRASYLERVHQQDVMPGVPEALETARKRGLRLAIASSSSRNWVTGHLERLRLDHYFDVVCCGDEVKVVKPDPELYHLALERLGLDAREAFVIEDSPKGIAAARAASLYCVVVPNPVTRASSLHDCNRRVEGLTSLSFARLIDETEKVLACAF